MPRKDLEGHLSSVNALIIHSIININLKLFYNKYV